MPSAFSDYLLVGGVPNQWIKVVNNATNTAYVSTTVTTSPTTTTPGGLFTFNPGPPADIYTTYTLSGLLSATAPAAGDVRWVATGNTHYVIAYTAGDSIVGRDFTADPTSPYVSLAAAGSMVGLVYDQGGMAYNLMNPVYGLLGTGVDEATTLNAAYAAIPSGSIVYYPAASVSYGIGASITPKANTKHCGAGRFTSVIKRRDHTNLKMFAVEGLAGQTFEDLGFDLNDANQDTPGLIPAIRFDKTSHYNTVSRCRFTNSLSFTIYTNVGSSDIAARNVPLGERYRDNEIVILASASWNDQLVPVTIGGYTMGNTITNNGMTGSAAHIYIYESDDHPCIGNTMDLSNNAVRAARAIALGSSVRCPIIANTLKGSQNDSGGTLIGIIILREGDNGTSAREQLDAVCVANEIFGFGRGYALKNGSAGIGVIANTEISGGRVDTCNEGIEFVAGTIVGVNVANVKFINIADRPWLSTVTPSFVKFVNCPGATPVGPLNIGAVPATGVEATNSFFADATVHVVGGTVTDLKVGYQPPPIIVISTVTTGGTLAGSATYAYRVSMVDNQGGESLACTEVTIAVPAGTNTNKVTITWYQPDGAPRGATGVKYNVYGRTSAAELKMASNQVTNTFTDDGSVTPSGALPASNATLRSLGLVMAATVPYTFRVPANQTAAIGYNSAPTWTWQGD